MAATWPSSRGLRGVLYAGLGLLAVIGLVLDTKSALSLGMICGVVALLAGWEFAADRPDGHLGAGWTVAQLALAGSVAGPVIVGGTVLVGGTLTSVGVLGAVVAVLLLLRRRAAGDSERERDGVRGRLARLSDAELNQEWRRSWARVANARNAAELERLRVLRRRQLDEMERRDPDGFRRWLDSGDWVSGDSAPFLGG